MKYLILTVTILICQLCYAQKFPASFTGHWQGELTWYKQNSKAPQKGKMQLIIQPSDTTCQFTWQLIYGENNKDNRPYLLKPVDTAKGHWIVDERNGILLDHFWVANRLMASFTVGKSTIVNSFRIDGDNLIAEFYSIGAVPVRASGGNDKDTPMVNSYPVGGYQYAVLRRG